MCLCRVNKTINIWLLVLLLCLFEVVFPKTSYEGQVRADYPKGCAYLRCKTAEQCVNRKFWCKNPPCPGMLYCSKSRKESLKGPSSCEAVRCSKGFICLIHARHCRWDEGCEQQMARCVSERDYYEGPASCVDLKCPSGHRCILRESLCAKPPCKLLKSCANTKDVKIWLEKCRNLGCLSEYDCFLRKPDHDCSGSPCVHTPDCAIKSEVDIETRNHCRGWVCPKGEECSSHTNGPCKRESCRISRSCHKPLMVPVNTTPWPQHSWRDDASIYTKEEKKSSESEGNRYSSRSFPDKISNTETINKNSTLNVKVENSRPIGKEKISTELPNSRTSSGTTDIISGRIVRPIVTSLTTWLNHLKLMTGVDAIEVWIRRANRQEYHEEFLEWLESVKDMLGTAAYDLWLEEVRAMTVTSPAFQKWLPSPPPTNRTTISRRHEGRDISFDSPNSPNDSINDEKNDFQPGGIHETVHLKTNDFQNRVYPPMKPIKPAKPIMEPVTTYDNSIPILPGFPPSLQTTGINEWSQFYSSNPRNFQRAYPSDKNFQNLAVWNNRAGPYQGFDNNAPFLLNNPTYPQFLSNWSLQQPPRNNPVFPGVQQDPFLPHVVHPPLQSASDPENPIKLYSRNSTKEDTSWTKYLADPYETWQFVAPENFGSFPVADKNFGYPSWPVSGYYGQSFADVPHRRSKHEDKEPDKLNFAERNAEGWDEMLRGTTRKDTSPYYSGFPWQFMEPRLSDSYLHLLRHYNRRNIYEKNNEDGSPFFSILPRSHRVDVDPRSRYFTGNVLGVQQPDDHWKSSYPNERLSRISGNRSPSFAFPVVEPRENYRLIDPSSKLTPFDVDDESTRGLVSEDRVNGVPGQTMELPDLWNSRYRNPSSAFLRKIVNREQLRNDETITRNHPSSTKSPPLVPSSRRTVTPHVFPSTSEHLLDEKKTENYVDDGKKFEDYPEGQDDGIYPLLLSLLGYIESPSRQVFPDSANPPKNSTILPVYTIEKDVRIEDDDDHYETHDDKDGINLFRNAKYGGRPDFPNNLKNVFQVEASLIMQNRTGESDVEVKDVKWEYEDADNSNTYDPSSIWDQMQASVSPIDESSNNDHSNGWIVDKSGAWNDGRTETDYYDERIDYGDEIIPGERSYFDPGEEINVDGTPNHRDTPDDLNDRYYDDSDHKRFKKNRPL